MFKYVSWRSFQPKFSFKFNNLFLFQLVFACILAFAAARPQIITPIVETYEAAPLFANAVRTYPLAEIEHQLPYFPANVVLASKPLVERLQIALK